nr:AAA family ATPase [uncultured Cohaesibacter sp.]
MRISYSIENLRLLEATPFVEIRPITILVGRNSSGKSTFLRSLPLIRQSLETKTSAPILWYGDYVDFGNFRSAVKDKDSSKNISFSFEFQDFAWRLSPTSEIMRQLSNLSIRANSRKVSCDLMQISYTVQNVTNTSNMDGKTKLKSIYVKLPNINSELTVEFNSYGYAEIIQIGNLEPINLEKFRIVTFEDILFGKILFLKKEKSGEKPYFSDHSHTFVLRSMIEDTLKSVADGRTSSKRITSEANRILRQSKLDEKSLSILENAETISFSKLYAQMRWGLHKAAFEKLNALCQANNLFGFLKASEEYLTSYFKSVEYIGPARVRSERFYRQQELEISEISPDGKNLPVFLASLKPAQLKDFSNWVLRTFGYGISVKKSEGHISINLDQEGHSINIVDTGYGVSQVLPVLAQIWWTQFAANRIQYQYTYGGANTKTLAIEQPELHLHPAHQALLADVFVEALSLAKENEDVSHNYVVETHSEALINRLGELIEIGENIGESGSSRHFWKRE